MNESRCPMCHQREKRRLNWPEAFVSATALFCLTAGVLAWVLA